MMTWNKWISKKIINDAMSTIYNSNWNNQIINSFNTMSAIMMVQLDSYTVSDNIKVNNVHVVYIIPTSH